MNRYILQDGSGVVRSARGDWVRYADALAESCPTDSQEGFRAFLARRGVAKFHSLYGAVLHEISALEDEASLHQGAVEEWKNQESIRNVALVEENQKLKADLDAMRVARMAQGDNV